MKDSWDKVSLTPMRAASPPRQMERENEMIVISHRLFCVHWRISLNASNYAGQHKGYHGNISVTYKF